jgi:hypothetical protein
VPIGDGVIINLGDLIARSYNTKYPVLCFSKIKDVNAIIIPNVDFFTGCLQDTLKKVENDNSNPSLSVIKRLVESGADVNIVTDGGNTALQEAALQGNLEIVNLLLAKNANVNFTNKWNENALMASCFKNGTPEVAQALIDAGADILANDVDGNSALDLATRSENIVNMSFSPIAKGSADNHSLKFTFPESFAKQYENRNIIIGSNSDSVVGNAIVFGNNIRATVDGALYLPKTLVPITSPVCVVFDYTTGMIGPATYNPIGATQDEKYHGQECEHLANVKECNFFYHPQWIWQPDFFLNDQNPLPDWAEKGGFVFQHNTEVEAQIQIGSKLISELPIRSSAEAYYHLRKSLGCHQPGSSYGVNILDREFRTSKFILAFDCERQTNAGSMG